MAEQEPNPEQELSNDDIRALLVPTAASINRIEGLLALGVDQKELFGLLEVDEVDLGLVSDATIEAHKEEIREDPNLTREILFEFGAKEEDLHDVEAYIEEQARRHNKKQLELFADPEFLGRRHRRIIDDLSRVASILMENDGNRPFIASWLTTPSHSCDGKRPIDQIKIDPVQVLASAHSFEFSDEGRLSDLEGHLK